ncbi:hypothetical protein BAE44_0001493 [Dichanthelium oligosanthes]|uniref:Disease resistance N-terminal domain-containing protein n=1 Tax=Dichanthelium oligosanthes TaxID=888268 RepID=A0A1E5WJH4_9POAL|nr:hypothetical protein BAE44_0001493 [Dichanthelium oligosanthes]
MADDEAAPLLGLHSAVSQVIDQTGDGSVQRITRMWGIYGELRTLERRMRSMQSVVANAELKAEKDPHVRNWVNAFKLATYRARDVLDEMMLLPDPSLATMPQSRQWIYDTTRKLKSVTEEIDMLASNEARKLGLVNPERPQVLHRNLPSRPWRAESASSDYSVAAAPATEVLEPSVLRRLFSEPGGHDSESGFEMSTEANLSGISTGERDLEANQPPSSTSTAQVSFLSCTHVIVIVEQIIGSICTDICSVGYDHQLNFVLRVGHQNEQRKRRDKYYSRAVAFSISMLVAFLNSASSKFFKVAFAVYSIALIAGPVFAKPDWESAMVYISSSLLVLEPYFLLVSSNKVYAYAIVPTVLLLIVPALVQYMRKPASGWVLLSNTDDEADQELDGIFEWSGNVANGGGLASLVLGHFTGPNQHTVASAVAGFLFLITVALGIYLMTVTTVRIKALTAHATHLHKLMVALFVGTFITVVMVTVFHL